MVMTDDLPSETTDHVIGPVRHSITGPWTIVATRERSGLLDAWQEHLCIRYDGENPTVAVCMPNPIEEAEYDVGELPAFVQSVAAFGVASGYVVGAFLVVPGKASVAVTGMEPGDIIAAVVAAGWDSPAPALIASIRDCALQAVTVPTTDLPEALADGVLMLIEGAYSTHHIFGSQGPALALVRAADALIGAYLATSYRYGPALEHCLRVGHKGAN